MTKEILRIVVVRSFLGSENGSDWFRFGRHIAVSVAGDHVYFADRPVPDGEGPVSEERVL